MKRTPLKKKATDGVSTLRNKCDALLTPIIKQLYPNCMLQAAQHCARLTQVAHHHVHKARSSRLRYELDNLIPLCNACHLALHMNESFWASKIVEKRGLKWFQKLAKMKDEYVKTDRFFYQANLERLSSLAN